MLRRSGVLLLGLALLVGCGLEDPAAVTPDEPETPVVQPTTAPIQGGGTLSPEVQGQVRQLVGRSLASFRSLPGYEVTLKYFQSQGTRNSTGTYQISGKGNAVRIVVQEGNGKGSRLLYSGGSTVKARPGGLLSPLVVTLGLDDPKLVSVRGYRINQILVPETLGQLMDPANTVMNAERAGGSYHLLVGGPGLLKGCQTLEAWLDETTLLPTRVQYSDGRAVVFWMKYEGLRKKANVSLDI